MSLMPAARSISPYCTKAYMAFENIDFGIVLRLSILPTSFSQSGLVMQLTEASE